MLSIGQIASTAAVLAAFSLVFDLGWERFVLRPDRRDYERAALCWFCGATSLASLVSLLWLMTDG